MTCTNVVDGWKIPIDFAREEGEDYIKYTFTSYGKDGLPSNDVIVEAIDVDHTVKAGKWIGNKMKGLTKGIKISITATNKTTGKGFSFFKKAETEPLEAE